MDCINIWGLDRWKLTFAVLRFFVLECFIRCFSLVLSKIDSFGCCQKLALYRKNTRNGTSYDMILLKHNSVLVSTFRVSTGTFLRRTECANEKNETDVNVTIINCLSLQCIGSLAHIRANFNPLTYNIRHVSAT